MQWFNLAAAILAISEEVFKAISDALNAGKQPAAIHAAITDHVAQLPAKIREQ